MSNLLSTTQAAAYLGLTERRVRKLASLGRIGKRLGARSFTFTAAELAAFKRKKRPGGRPKS